MRVTIFLRIMCRRNMIVPYTLLFLLFFGSSLSPAEEIFLLQGDTVIAGQQSFDSMEEYLQSDYFIENGKRCGTQVPPMAALDDALARSVNDCTLALTIIQEEYWPDVTYTLPLWWHVIYKSDGTGNIDDTSIEDQIQVLNEDFLAKTGTLGKNGFDVRIRFELAGITRTMNDEWFTDSETDELAYKAALARDPNRYLNIYSNNAGGALGYSRYPQEIAGHILDGVVMLWSVVGGRESNSGPYNHGRTLVHEVGHYLGLLHTFYDGSCVENSYTEGDLIADTTAENDAHYGCVQENSCGSPDPIDNYMSYADDTCMEKFTPEQANRMVCSLLNYRPDIYSTASEFPWPLFLQIFSGRQHSRIDPGK